MQYQVLASYEDEEGNAITTRFLPHQHPEAERVFGFSFEQAAEKADALADEGYDRVEIHTF